MYLTGSPRPKVMRSRWRGPIVSILRVDLMVTDECAARVAVRSAANERRCVGVQVDAGGGEGCLPGAGVLRVLDGAHAGAPRRLDDVAQAALAARQRSFDRARLQAPPHQAQARPAHAALQYLHAAVPFLGAQERSPLMWAMGAGDIRRRHNVHLRLAVDFLAADVTDAARHHAPCARRLPLSRRAGRR